MSSSRPHLSALLLGAFAGLIAAACGPIRYDGPTAIIVKVLLNEGAGTRLMYFSGVDDTQINVFPSVYRPESPSATDLPTGETVRILLDDSLAGTAVTLLVVGLDETGTPIESGQSAVTIVARQENSVTVKLSLYDTGTDAGSPDAGRADAGSTDAGLDGGVSCKCTTGCCDKSGACAAASKLVAVGLPGEFCSGVCDPLRSDRYSPDAGCGCGAHALCGAGLRCSSGKCICDQDSDCSGCCVAGSSGGVSTNCQGRAAESAASCGTAGFQCGSCDTGTTCGNGVCSKCEAAQGKCCSGSQAVNLEFPTCAGITNACNACDTTRSDRCSTQFGCGCGSLAACGANSLCIDAGCVNLGVVR